ncbi:MAG: bifunctional 4-hydroxy-3-methylbut-2-enyl diphosphate reductase/30S ribosomal protein S1 [Defluviitaleaceae bacterium]|nr:bifunctional 4-hydroxy-3-methylbut-2-enyl diphosphate reductase/30S ribosomal protein S1 [Defluviitaleaceae bacterium]
MSELLESQSKFASQTLTIPLEKGFEASKLRNDLTEPAITVGKYAGFCGGASLALQKVYKASETEKLCTYGSLIHNKEVVKNLEDLGIFSIDNIDDADGRTVVIRAHGVPPSIYREMEEKGIQYIDCTCVDVKKTQQIVENEHKKGRQLIIAGSANHPEVIGHNGHCDNKALIIENVDDFIKINFDIAQEYSLVAQTTFNEEIFSEISQLIQKSCTKVRIFDTLCASTKNRQKEAAQLSKTSDMMVVIGDKLSSNSVKLYEICKENCENTIFIETINELLLKFPDKGVKIGMIAGASTPPETIKGAFIAMSEVLQGNGHAEVSFQEMLDDSFVSLRTGDVVIGTVIGVINGEVSVNLGYKSDGVIPRTEFSEDQSLEPVNCVKAGDEIEVFVVRVNDGDGNVMLSKRKLEANKNYATLETAFEEKTPIQGKIVNIIKGGLTANILGFDFFVPSSHISDRFVKDLEPFRGKTFDFHIIEFDKRKKRRIASRKDLAKVEFEANRERIFGSLEVGSKVKGVVTRISDFGAFVDLGGIDGLIHVSEMTWGRIPKVREILKEGDEVNVIVISIDSEKGKIALSLKDESNNPWANIDDKYPIGAVVTGKVVRLVPFGAFVELEPGLDGLVHISQIANTRIENPQDVLQIGETIDVKIISLDVENNRISLSKKAAELSLEYDYDDEAYDDENYEDDTDPEVGSEE